MKLSTSRTLLAVALALGLTACGGKASFEIRGSIFGLQYPGLKLTETKSGAVKTIAPTETIFSFGNIDYGTSFDLTIATADQPLHQFCTVSNGSDTAGRTASINITVSCVTNSVSLAGLIKVTPVTGATAGLPTGLKLINGSVAPFVAVDGSTTYAFPAVAYGTPYSMIIAAQPTQPSKTTCVFDTTDTTVIVSPDKLSVQGTMGDTAPVINVNCTTTT